MLLLNFGLVYFFSGSVYYFVGIFYTFIAILLTLLLRKSKQCYALINVFVKNWGNSELIGEENGNMILLSVAFLIGAIKIGAAIALFVEVSAILFLVLAILLATGFWFDICCACGKRLEEGFHYYNHYDGEDHDDMDLYD